MISSDFNHDGLISFIDCHLSYTLSYVNISIYTRLWVTALGYSGFTFEVPTSTFYRFAIKELKIIIRAFKLVATSFFIFFSNSSVIIPVEQISNKPKDVTSII